jgi:hypothetical protein
MPSRGGQSKAIRYKRRVVAFYDVLGWHNKIAWAGSNRRRLKHLHDTVRLFAHLAKSDQSKENARMRMTCFSDNVVISDAVGRWPLLLYRLGLVQLYSASAGIYIKGGVTIGQIIHENDAVFGPALNRAYEIESTVSIFPRITLDRELLDLFDHSRSNFVVTENGVTFLDPFTPNFVNYLTKKKAPPTRTFSDPFNESKLLDDVVNSLRSEMTEPIGTKELEKLGWLYTRVMNNLPHSSHQHGHR